MPDDAAPHPGRTDREGRRHGSRTHRLMVRLGLGQRNRNAYAVVLLMGLFERFRACWRSRRAGSSRRARRLGHPLHPGDGRRQDPYVDSAWDSGAHGDPPARRGDDRLPHRARDVDLTAAFFAATGGFSALARNHLVKSGVRRGRLSGAGEQYRREHRGGRHGRRRHRPRRRQPWLAATVAALLLFAWPGPRDLPRRRVRHLTRHPRPEALLTDAARRDGTPAATDEARGLRTKAAPGSHEAGRSAAWPTVRTASTYERVGWWPAGGGVAGSGGRPGAQRKDAGW